MDFGSALPERSALAHTSWFNQGGIVTPWVALGPLPVQGPGFSALYVADCNMGSGSGGKS